jgi:soluble lytic murein transglycosylase-like protein
MRYRIFITCMGCASILAIEANMAFADATMSTSGNFDEPPKIQALLSAAKNYEKTLNSPESAWQAAVNYCEASRLGSIEAQYRLGMLYRFGKGVTTNQTFAAALFSLASSQGHAEALNMLDTTSLTSSELPPCVTGEVLPDRAAITNPTTLSDANDIERQLRGLPSAKRWIIDLVDTIAARHNIDPKLVLAIIAVESNFDVSARSPKNAMGLMQLIPDTADRFNIKNAFDAAQNIKGGIKYLRWLLSYYQGNVALAAAAYNSGEKTVDRYRGVPPYPETKNYVKRVMNLYRLQSHPYDEELTKPSPITVRSS